MLAALDPFALFKCVRSSEHNSSVQKLQNMGVLKASVEGTAVKAEMVNSKDWL